MSEKLLRTWIKTLLVEEITDDRLRNVTNSKSFKSAGASEQIMRLISYTSATYKEELSGIFSVLSPGKSGTTVTKNAESVDALISKVRKEIGTDTMPKGKMRSPDNPIVSLSSSPEDAYWAAYAMSEESTAGNKIEDAIAAYCNKKSPGSALAVDAAGHDLTIGGNPAEVKSSKSSSPTVNLNASFLAPDASKVYLFVLNSASTSHTILVCSSDLLYRVFTSGYMDDAASQASEELASSGEELSQLAQQDSEEGRDAKKKLQKLRRLARKDPDSMADAIENAFKTPDAQGGVLGTLDIRDIVKNTILTGKPTDERLSVRVGGHDVGVRIRIDYSLRKFSGGGN